MNSPEAEVFMARERPIRIKMTNKGKYLCKCCFKFPSEQTSAAKKRTQSKNNVNQEMNEMVTQNKIRTTGAHMVVGRAEVQSWRRFSGRSVVINSLLLALILINLECLLPATSQQLTSFIRPQQQHYNYAPVQQQQHHHHQQHTPMLSLASDRCKIGPPLQWRPYLDASSKAYLAPVVALATLKQFNLTPIQLAGSGRGHSKNGLLDRLHSQQSIMLHAQSINNVGVLIEATFQVKSLLRRSRSTTTLQPGSIIKLHYKVDASLATTSDIITLYSRASANEDEQQVNKQQNQTLLPIYQEQAAAGGAQHQYAASHHHLQPVINPNGNQCALELTEKELVKRGSKLFKVNQDYALFLEQTITAHKRVYDRQQAASSSSSTSSTSSNQPTRLATNYYWVDERSWHPFAVHEPMTSQTGRAIQKILCRGCVRSPTVQLVNSTFVSARQDESARQQQRRAINAHSSPSASTIRLDCRVSGAPSPWVEWFRNGKLLRNKPNSRMRIKTSKLAQGKGRSNDKLSWLEIDLQSGYNETGIYECRAMSVAAREPVVGTYTLLVMPAQFALIPMQHPIGGGGGGEVANELDEPRRTSPKQRAEDRKGAAATTLIELSTTTTTTTVTATSTSSIPQSAQTTALANADKADDDQATPTSTSPPPVPLATTTAQASTSTMRPNRQVQGEQQRDDDNNNEPDDQRVQIRPSPLEAGGSGSGIQSTRRPPHSSESGSNTSMALSGASARTPPPPPAAAPTQPSKGRGKSSPVVVGQPCPGDAHDRFCMNKGTCVLIGHIEEYFCNCAEGYHGHRCEYKSLGHQQTSRR